MLAAPALDGPGRIAAVAAQAGVIPGSKANFEQSIAFSDGSEGKCDVDSEMKNSAPAGTKVVTAVVKMRNEVGAGIPEIGMVLSPGKTSSCDAYSQARNDSFAPDSQKVCQVKQVVQGSPAHRCGTVRAGDIIVRVNSIDVSNMDADELVALLRKSAIDCKWTYAPLRLEFLRKVDAGGDDVSTAESEADEAETQSTLMTLMSIAVRKNSRMVASKKPNPIRLTLLQRSFCDRLDKALAHHGYYDAVYRL